MGFAVDKRAPARASGGSISQSQDPQAVRLDSGALLWIATILAAGIRFPRAARWPLYGDEASTAFASGSEFTWTNLRPLAFAFNHFIAVPLLGNTELALRLGSLIAGVSAVPLASLAVRRWFGPVAGLAAAFVVALSPALVVHSQFARYYMQAMLLSGAMLYCLHEWSVRRELRWLAWSVTWFVLGWFTVQSTSFVLPGFVLWAVCNPRDSGLTALPSWIEKHLPAAAALALAAIVLAMLLLQRLFGAEGEQLATNVRYFSPTSLALSLANGFGPAIAVLMAAGLPLCWSDHRLPRAERTFLPLVTLGTLATFAAAFPFLAIGPAHVLSAAALPLVALAGLALGRVAGETLPAPLGVAAAGAILLLPSRELISTQLDGGRPDYRWAIRVIRQQPGSTGAPVFATSVGVVHYYAPELGAHALITTPDSLSWLRDPGRIQTAYAIVAETRRGPEVDDSLLGVNEVIPACRLLERFERPRLDYSIAAVRVYVCPPPGQPR